MREKPRFKLVREAGRDWFVRRDGPKLWSFGVCCVDQGVNAETYDPKNPGYAAYRYYPTPDQWAQDTLTRLSQWGFNTVGAWSDDANLLAPNQPDIVFTPILHIGSSAGAPWRDMWDPKVVKAMDDVARVQIQAHHGDPRVLGYFSDNEMGWWYGAMFDWAFKAGPAARGHLVELFQEIYKGNWRRLRRDFDPDGATGFSELRHKGRLFLRPGGSGMRAVQAWMTVVSDRYYSLCRSIIKRYDPGAQYLGDRYISNFYPEIARSAGRYCDVVSTNLNADDSHGDFARFYLPSLHAICGRPIMITEYYVAAKENASGNENNSSGFPVVDTQAERASVFERQTETFLRTPYIVGAHWFQYYDEPKRGRGDGENYDMGLIDTSNRPYLEMTEAAAKMGAGAPPLARSLPRAKPRGSCRLEEEGLGWRSDRGGIWNAGEPPPPNPFSSSRHIHPAAGGTEPESAAVYYWMHYAKFVPPVGRSDRGDLYIGHYGKRLFVTVYWNEDRFGEAFYRAGKVPEIDRARLRLTVGGRRIDVRMGDGPQPTVLGPASATTVFSGVRNLTCVTLPEMFGRRIDAILETRGRAYRVHWQTP